MNYKSCHINRLKAYHEKPKPELVTLNNKLGLENPTHKEDCADLEAEKEEDSESEVTLGMTNNPQSCKTNRFLPSVQSK